MDFFSRSDYPKSCCTDPGSGTSPSYVKAYDEDGIPYLKEVGVSNDYDIIQSHHDDTRIESIVSRFEAGDSTVLQRLNSFYADLSSMPKDLMTAQNALIKSQNLYNIMPADVKRAYPNLLSFINAVGTDELKAMVSPEKKSTVEEVNSDVDA